MSYTTPEVGTILPAQENKTVINPGYTRNQDVMNEWLQAQQQATAWRKNKILAEDYNNYFNQSWLYEYSQGQTPGDATPPKPPAACVIVVRSAEAGGVYFDMLPSGQTETSDTPGTGPYIPVCKVPEYKRKS